jgi:hypothetical protein
VVKDKKNATTAKTDEDKKDDHEKKEDSTKEEVKIAPSLSESQKHLQVQSCFIPFTMTRHSQYINKEVHGTTRHYKMKVKCKTHSDKPGNDTKTPP